MNTDPPTPPPPGETPSDDWKPPVRAALLAGARESIGMLEMSLAETRRELAEARRVPSRLGRDIAEDIMIALGHNNTDHHKRDPLVLMVWDRFEACGITPSEDD